MSRAQLRLFELLCFLVLSVAASRASLRAQSNVEILFRVDMNVQTELGRFDPFLDFVVVRGALNFWACSDPMIESVEEPGVYEIELQVPAHVIGAGEFKFNINCGEGAAGRWEDAISNRSYRVTGNEPDADGDGFGEIVLDTVFFDDAIGGLDLELFFSVDLSLLIESGRFDPLAQIAVVRGAFNSWTCSEPLVESEDEETIFEIRVPVEGHLVGTGQFKFNLDCSDTGWEDSIPNRRYRVTGDETDSDGNGLREIVIPTVFFDDEERGPDLEITLAVDMNAAIAEGRFDPAFDTVLARGTFSGGGCSEELEETEVPGVYAGELEAPSHPLGAGTYKFNISCLDAGTEDLIADREYLVTGEEPDEDGDGFLELDLGLATFNQVDLGGVNVAIEFTIDMSVVAAEGGFDPALEGVVARGEFNGWECSEELEALGDGFYRGVVLVEGHPLGSTEYKYNIACQEAGWEDEIPNREYFVSGDEEDLDGDGFIEISAGTVFFEDREPPEGVGPFLRGDCGQAGTVNISSGIFLLSYLFVGGEAPACFAACDADGDGRLDITTAVYMFNFLFLGGDPPPEPATACGISGLATDAELGCESPSACL